LFFQKLNPYLDKLSKIVAIFVQSAPFIAKKQQDKDTQDLKGNRRFIITVILTLKSVTTSVVKPLSLYFSLKFAALSI
jgi:hypothetical protein